MVTIIVLWILLGIITFIVILLHFSLTIEIKGSTSDEDFDFRVKYLWFTIYPKAEKKAKKTTTQKEIAPVTQDDIFTDSLDEELEDLVDENENLSPEQQQEKAEKILAKIKSGDEITGEVEQEKDGISKACELEVKDNEKITDSTKESSSIKKAKKKKEKSKRQKKAKNQNNGEKLQDLKEKYYFIKPYIPMGWKYFKKLLKAVRILKLRVNLTVGKEDAYECAMFYGKIQAVLFNVLGAISGIFTVKIKEANVNCVFNEKKFEAEGDGKICVRPSTMIAIAFCLVVSFLCEFLPKFLKEKLRKRKAYKNKKAQKAKSSSSVNAV